MSTNKLRDGYRLVEAARRTMKVQPHRLEDIRLFSPDEVDDYSFDGFVAVGDWNTITRYDEDVRRYVDVDDTPKRLGEALEAIGFQLDWSDTTSTCDDCGKLVQTEPDSYGWRAKFITGDGFLRCLECVESDPVEYLESIEGNPRTACVHGIDPAKHGYVCVKDRMENGFHDGQDDDPKVVAAALRERGVERFLFQIDDVGQFDLRFSVYVHESETDKLDEDKAIESLGHSVSGAMKAGLQAASIALAKLPDGEGVKYAKINPDGTADVRLVSPEEFVDGIKK